VSTTVEVAARSRWDLLAADVAKVGLAGGDAAADVVAAVDEADGGVAVGAGLVVCSAGQSRERVVVVDVPFGSACVREAGDLGVTF
jgi:hypothetical protein